MSSVHNLLQAGSMALAQLGGVNLVHSGKPSTEGSFIDPAKARWLVVSPLVVSTLWHLQSPAGNDVRHVALESIAPLLVSYYIMRRLAAAAGLFLGAQEMHKTPARAVLGLSGVAFAVMGYCLNETLHTL
ncbi:MAG: hypothetical protein IPJ69_03555 [Deltaproteobacteria bacterium]|nr:MAG: hypothetical protein IPJ69_03555 [Deltaproteobacteria bacterium]